MKDSNGFAWFIHRISSVIFTVSALILCLTVIPAGAARVPQGSFLKYTVHSTSELLQQIRKEPIVSTRFARLFNMSPEMVRSAFSRLHVAVMNSDSIRKIYYVHPGEQIGYRVRRLKKGTMVFAYPDGTPVLVVACGNPIRSTGTIARSSLLKVPDYSEMEEVALNSTGPQASLYPLRNETPDTTRAVETPVPGFVPEVEVVPSNQPVPSFHESLPPAQLRAASSNALLYWLGGAALIGSLASIHGSSSNGGNNNGGNVGGNVGGNANGSDVGGNNGNGVNGNMNGGNIGGNNGGNVGGIVGGNNGGNINGGNVGGNIGGNIGGNNGGNVGGNNGANNGNVNGGNNGGNVGGNNGENNGGNVGGNSGGNVGGNNGAENGANIGGNNGGDVGENNGGNNGDHPPVVPESNGLLLFASAAGGCLVFLGIKKRLTANSRP